MRVVTFYVSCPARRPPPASSASCSSASCSSASSAGPQLQALDRSIPPDPNSKPRIRESRAGRQLQALDRSGPRRARTATSGSKWPLPDLDHKESPKIYQIGCQKECQKTCQIHMPEKMSEDLPDRMPGGRGGEDNFDEISSKLSFPPLPCQKVLPKKMLKYMPDRMPDRIECQNICQIECFGGDHSK